MADSFSFEAIGTAWRVDTGAILTSGQRARLLHLAEEYDALYSRFRTDSRVTALAAAGGSLPLPPHGAELGRLLRTLYDLTDGGVSPLVGDPLTALGYDVGYSLTPTRPPAPARAWDDVLTWTDEGLTLQEPAILDIGAAGKGQLVDLMLEYLSAEGHEDVIVDASGDMRRAGEGTITVALEHPYDPSSAIGAVSLGTGALCASASNRRVWGDGLHHVLDARTGRSVDTVVATWALAADAMTADGLCTALFLTDPTDLAEAFAFDYVLMYSDGRARCSAPLAGALFS
ncbi:FAD:protein FMN transferase [Arthrobacter pityocampae]|uniref:FAD:protein FMN transferase n=1 Tax=Arthrobacter pityocampae TaxID=547334 RepID=A0A2S5J1M6_9MICC|nr:FAD:protein FMN transferase [Arthrobacter pityocampae]PPB50701.1 FAD:protein FMN transferase [Arthrobacter pityocampae]